MSILCILPSLSIMGSKPIPLYIASRSLLYRAVVSFRVSSNQAQLSSLHSGIEVVFRCGVLFFQRLELLLQTLEFGLFARQSALRFVYGFA